MAPDRDTSLPRYLGTGPLPPRASPMVKSASALHFGNILKQHELRHDNTAGIEKDLVHLNPDLLALDGDGRRDKLHGHSRRERSLFQKVRSTISERLGSSSQHRGRPMFNISQPLDFKRFDDPDRVDFVPEDLQQSALRSLAVNRNLGSPKVRKLFQSTPPTFFGRHSHESTCNHPSRSGLQGGQKRVSTDQDALDTSGTEKDAWSDRGEAFGIGFSAFHFDFDPVISDMHIDETQAHEDGSTYVNRETTGDLINVSASIAGPHQFSNKISGLRQHPNVLKFTEPPAQNNARGRQGFNRRREYSVYWPVAKEYNVQSQQNFDWIQCDESAFLHKAELTYYDPDSDATSQEPSSGSHRTSEVSKRSSAEAGLSYSISPSPKKTKFILTGTEMQNTDLAHYAGPTNRPVIRKHRSCSFN